MRILFLNESSLWVNSLPNGFKDLGHEVVTLRELTDETVPGTIKEFRPQLIGTSGWSQPHAIDIMEKYVKGSGIPFFIWATEEPGSTWCYTLPVVKKLQPNFIFTVCVKRIEFYKSLGYKAAYLDFGYHEKAHYRTPVEEKYRVPVAVVANGYYEFMKNYPEHFRLKSVRDLITPLVQKKIQVHLWGEDWKLVGPLIGCSIPDNCIHDYLDYTEANKVYSSADIVLGIQNRLDQVTMRTYEILGSEGFLLASDTPAIKSLFKPGRDLVVSSTPKETISLVNYYLNNPSKREEIRKNGRRAVAPYNYRNYAAYIINTLKQQKVLNNDI